MMSWWRALQLGTAGNVHCVGPKLELCLFGHERQATHGMIQHAEAETRDAL